MRDVHPALGVELIAPPAGQPELLGDLQRDAVDVLDRELVIAQRVDPLLEGVVAALLGVQAQRVHELEVRERVGDRPLPEIEEREIFHALRDDLVDVRALADAVVFKIVRKVAELVRDREHVLGVARGVDEHEGRLIVLQIHLIRAVVLFRRALHVIELIGEHEVHRLLLVAAHRLRRRADHLETLARLERRRAVGFVIDAGIHHALVKRHELGHDRVHVLRHVVGRVVAAVVVIGVVDVAVVAELLRDLAAHLHELDVDRRERAVRHIIIVVHRRIGLQIDLAGVGRVQEGVCVVVPAVVVHRQVGVRLVVLRLQLRLPAQQLHERLGIGVLALIAVKRALAEVVLQRLALLRGGAGVQQLVVLLVQLDRQVVAVADLLQPVLVGLVDVGADRRERAQRQERVLFPIDHVDLVERGFHVVVIVRARLERRDQIVHVLDHRVAVRAGVFHLGKAYHVDRLRALVVHALRQRAVAGA